MLSRAIMAGIRNHCRLPWRHAYPSRLVLGSQGGRALHVVATYNAADDETIVVTAYEPTQACVKRTTGGKSHEVHCLQACRNESRHDDRDA